MCMIEYEYFPNYLLCIVENFYQVCGRLKLFIPAYLEDKTNVSHIAVTFQSRWVIPIEKQIEFVCAFPFLYVVHLPVRK